MSSSTVRLRYTVTNGVHRYCVLCAWTVRLYEYEYACVLCIDVAALWCDAELRDEEGKLAVEKARERNSDGHKEVVAILHTPH